MVAELSDLSDPFRTLELYPEQEVHLPVRIQCSGSDAESIRLLLRLLTVVHPVWKQAGRRGMERLSGYRHKHADQSGNGIPLPEILRF